MSISTTEYAQLVTNHASRHAADATRAAALRSFCVHVFDHYSRHMCTDLTSLRTTLDACIEAFLDDRGIGPTEMLSAGASLNRAGRTLAYMESLPT